MTNKGPTIDQAVETYIKLRSQKEAVEAETKDRVKDIKDKMEKLEAWIMQQADAAGVTSFKTPHGTAFLTTSDFAGVSDWDAVLDYIKKNDAFDLLERRVSKAAVRAHMDANGEVPAGVSFGTKVSVNVRKPAAKAD